jgi:signal transduction histidine kinase
VTSALPEGRPSFLASVNHELRTPMTSVIGYTDLLLDEVAGPLSGDQRDMLQRVRSNAGRLQGLIEDLLATSGLEPGGDALGRDALGRDALGPDALDPDGVPLRPSSGTTSAATTGSAG